MKNIRLFELESEYLAEKESLEYPTVSYIKEIEQVGYVKKPIPNSIITATYHITEDSGAIGQTIALAEGVVGCTDIILDGVSLATPATTTNHVATPTSFGTYDTVTFTEDSWAKSPANPWNVTFNRPLTENDMFLFAIEVMGESMVQPLSFKEAYGGGIMTPLDDTLQNWQCMYTVSTAGMDFNMVVCAFTPQDENLTIAEDNFVGASYEITSGGVPSAVIVTPTEPTTYTVQYIITEGEGDKVLIKQISYYASSVDLSAFDTSHMTDMSNMFSGCSAVTSIDLSSLDTSNVTNMENMFYYCTRLTSLDLSSFDTSNVTDMSSMFIGCRNLTSLDLSNFNTSKVTDMSDMFAYCNSLTSLDLSSLDTSNVIDMTSMFSGCKNLTSMKFFKKIPANKTCGDLLGYDLKNRLTSLDLSSWDVSNYTSLNRFCDSLSALTNVTFGDNFDMSTVIDAGRMFLSCTSLRSIYANDLNLSNAKYLYQMFYNCTSLTSLDISTWKIDKCTHLFGFLNGCSNLTSFTITQDLNNIATFEMLNGCNAPSLVINHNGNCDEIWKIHKNHSRPDLETIFIPSLNDNIEIEYDYIIETVSADSTTSAVTCVSSSLMDYINIAEVDGVSVTPSSSYTFNTIGLHTVKYGIPKIMPIISCADCIPSSIISIDLSHLNMTYVMDYTRMFGGCSRLTSITFNNNFISSHATYMNGMFSGCSGLTSLDLSSFGTSNVTDMNGMFSGCTSLTSLDLSNFDTSNVTDMSSMFIGCRNLTSLDLSNFDTSNVTNMSYMFISCNSLTSLTFSENFGEAATGVRQMFTNCGKDGVKLDFSPCKFKTCAYMFEGDGRTYIDVSTLDTSNVTSMLWMFESCTSLTSLNVSNFDTSNVTDMSYMFDDCSGLTSLDLSSFDTSNVTYMIFMFGSCNSLTSLDLSNFDTSKVTDMSYMFAYCGGLTSFIFGPQWNVSKVNYKNMFTNTNSSQCTIYYPLKYQDAWNVILVSDRGVSKLPSTTIIVPIDYENGETIPTA